MALSRQQGGGSSCRSPAPPGRILPSMRRAHERLGCESSLPPCGGPRSRCARCTLEAALNGYLHAFVANLISAAVRAVPPASDGQRTLAAPQTP